MPSRSPGLEPLNRHSFLERHARRRFRAHKRDRQKEIARIPRKEGIVPSCAKSEVAQIYPSALRLAGIAPMSGEVFWPHGSWAG